MKRRILALLLALLFVLSACGEEEGSLEDPNATKRAAPITLSLCMVAESYTEDARLSIQAALNEITREEYNTNVVLYIVTKDQYQKVVNDKLTAAENSQIVTPNKDANGLPLVDEGYPALGVNQFDVLWIDGYEHMLELVEAKKLIKLPLSEQKLISQYIDPVALEMAGMYEFATYAVPVRHVFGDYTYLLLRKDVVGHTDVAFDPNGVNSLSTLAPYLTKVHDLKELEKEKLEKEELAEEDAFFANMTVLQNMPDARYLRPAQALVADAQGKTSLQVVEGLLLGSNACFPKLDKEGIPHSTLTFKNSAPLTLLTNPEYQDEVIYSSLFEELDMLGTGEVTDATDCAAAFVKGDASLIDKYKDDYYVIEYSKPIATRDTLSESMFAVSHKTVSENRSLELISALVTNPEICNLLAYGVEDEHYEIISEGDEDVVDFIVAGEGKYVETNVYKNSGLYCGNQFLTMPYKGMTPSERALAANNWYAAADQDMAMTIDPFTFFYIDTTKGDMKNILPSMQALFATVKANIDGFTDFADFKVYYGELIPDPNNPTNLIPDPDKVRPGTTEEYVAAYREFLAVDQLAILMANETYTKTFGGSDPTVPATNRMNSVAGQYNSWYGKTKLGTLASADE